MKTLITLWVFGLCTYSLLARGVPYDPNMGPVVGTAVKISKSEGGKNVSFRANIVPFDETAQAGVVFDADTMRLAAGWTGGGLVLEGLPFTGGHGAFPHIDSDPIFSTRAMPGWANPLTDQFEDPREGPYPPLGPLPRSWMDYHGYYLNGNVVVFAYRVGKAEVLERQQLIGGAIKRTINVSGMAKPLKVLLASECLVPISIEGLPGAQPEKTENGWILEIPANGQRQQFAVFYGECPKAGRVVDDLRRHTRGGAARWTETISTKGVLATDSKPYVVDRITVPYKNPYGVKMRIGGMDFFKDGTTAAVCTWDGDVWLVKNIDDSLENVVWKRFASGQHEPLGLKIVDDIIYTVADDQITRYHDTNNDEEADYYECFNSDWDLTSGFHAFCFDLHTDPQGNFYFAYGSPVRGGGRSFERMGEHHGSIIKVTKDGRTLSRYASGLRAPNGMGVSPTGQVTSGDNEGTFVPRSPVNWIKEGDFLGVVDSYAKYPDLKTTPTVRERQGGREQHLDVSEMPKPLVWLPKNVDNSGGGQVWVESERWGPFAGALLHMSYGRSSLSLVLKEEKAGQVQGGVVKFPLKFTSSAMRARFNAADGQLYVAGLKGWQSNAAKEGGFDRVRYTGAPVALPSRLEVDDKHIKLAFTCKLNRELAEDPTSYAIRASMIRWSHGYGSGEFKVGEDSTGWTAFKVESAKLLPDGQTVSIKIPDLVPVHMMEIKLDLETEEGSEIYTQINNTIHEL